LTLQFWALFLFYVVRAAENRNKPVALTRVVAAPPHRLPFLAVISLMGVGEPDGRVGNLLSIRWSPSPAPGTVNAVCLNR
jgi:hypothetical protein